MTSQSQSQSPQSQSQFQGQSQGLDDADAPSGKTGDVATLASAPETLPAPAPNISLLARTVLNDLRQRFQAFSQCLPLAIGIDKLLLVEMPELNRKTLRVALNMHTNSSRYLKAMSSATMRFDLAGNAVTEVAEEHRARAAEMLKERFKKEREQRNAAAAVIETKRKADMAQAKVEAEIAARSEKLNLLAAKFSGVDGKSRGAK
jgi:ProP effector